MWKIMYFRNDLRQIMRDPIMAIMLLAPVLTVIVFKGFIAFVVPVLLEMLQFDISAYSFYIQGFVMLINAGLLGIVTGFMMLDDKDGDIATLMSITPLGRIGYLVNRLTLASFLSFIYCGAAIYVLWLVDLPLLSVLFLSLLMAMYTAIIGLLIFWGAEDKVKGLTFAKAINSLVLFAFTDLFALRWLIVLSWFFPPYWITRIMAEPQLLHLYLVAMIVHLGWLGALILRYWRR